MSDSTSILVEGGLSAEGFAGLGAGGVGESYGAGEVHAFCQAYGKAPLKASPAAVVSATLTLNP